MIRRTSTLSSSFKWLLLVVFCVCSGTVLYAQQNHSTPSDSLINGILTLINQHRKSIGRGPLVLDATTCQAADKHSKNMAGGKIPFGHDGFNPRMALLAKKLGNIDAFAENVAQGPTTAADAVDLWLHSPGHKKNIEGDYNLTGIGIAKAKDGELYYTQIFLKKNK